MQGINLSFEGQLYVLLGIVRFGRNAPDFDLRLSTAEKFEPTGIDAVDNADVHITRIDGIYKLVTGYNKVRDLISNTPKSELRNVTINAKLISPRFMSYALVENYKPFVERPKEKSAKPQRQNTQKPRVKEEVKNTATTNAVGGAQPPQKKPKPKKHKTAPKPRPTTQTNTELAVRFRDKGFKVGVIK